MRCSTCHNRLPLGAKSCAYCGNPTRNNTDGQFPQLLKRRRDWWLIILAGVALLVFTLCVRNAASPAIQQIGSAVTGGIGLLLLFAALYDTLLPLLVSVAYAGALALFVPDPLFRWSSSALAVLLGVVLWQWGRWLPYRNGLTPREWQSLRAEMSLAFSRLRDEKLGVERPFAAVLKRHHELTKIKRPDANSDGWKRAQVSYHEQKLAIAPVNEGEISTHIHKSATAYRLHHAECLVMLFNNFASAEHLRSAQVDVTWQNALIDNLIASCEMETFRSIYEQHQSLKGRLPHANLILEREGVVEGTLSFVERVLGKGVTKGREDDRIFLRRFTQDLDRYLSDWDALRQAVTKNILPRHRRVFAEATETSVTRAMGVCRSLSAQGVPLRPLLKTLRRLRKSANCGKAQPSALCIR